VKLTLVTILALALLMASPALLMAESDSDMLERSIPGIVTVAVYKGDDLTHPFGFGAADAYEHLLDLSGALGSGSGFCIERNGKKYIVTNCHVIQNAAADDANAIIAFSINQNKYTMKIVGADSFIDIAVLEFKGKQPGDDVRPLKFAADVPRLGERVFAIGNPYGEYPYSISTGIVGGLNRIRGGITAKFGYLESTATVAWGNSGGPLINDKGDVVGVNSAIEIRQRFQQMVIQPQINFALEGAIASRALDEFIAAGHIRRAFLGVRFSQDFAVQTQNNEEQTLDIGAPAIVGDLLPDSPAATALANWKGATVKKVNGQEVRNIEEVLGALEILHPGDDCTLELERDGKTDEVKIKTAELTPDAISAWASHLLTGLGVEIKETPDGLTFRRTVADAPAENPAHENPQQGGPNVAPQQGDPRNRFKQFDYNDRKAGFHRPAPTPAVQPDAPVLAVGIFDADGHADQLWRTNNLHDLGIAIRLTALAGRIDLANHGADDKYNVLRVWLSGEENKLSKSLLY
jgi:S1-C subfamily serine protease